LLSVIVDLPKGQKPLEIKDIAVSLNRKSQVKAAANENMQKFGN